MENLKTFKKGYELTCELRDLPVSFVNGLRRTILSEIPTVCIQDIQILENTSQMPHEMLKHRIEMLPVNVSPDDSAIIRSTSIELRIMANPNQKEVETITTNDFVIQSGRETVLMKDRDLNTPMLFMRIRPNESVHFKARLGLEKGSQVCCATTGWHIDPELAKIERKKHVESGKDPRIFDNFLIQRCYSKGANGRPNWFDLKVESIGVLSAKDILNMAVKILRKSVVDYVTDALKNIVRSPEKNTYTVSLEYGGHTIGSLLQETMYSDLNINFVSYDIPHPLRNTMILKFNTTKNPELVLESARTAIEEYCSLVEKGL
jgi:DNA-directed RNA polymerase subunit L